MRMTIRSAVLGSALLALVGCAGGGSDPSITAATTAEPTGTGGTPVSVTVRDFKIEPNTLTSTGSTIINVSSKGPTPHNFTVRDAADATITASKDLRTGESDTVVLAALAPGEYTFFCSFAGARDLGMRGTLTVTQ